MFTGEVISNEELVTVFLIRQTGVHKTDEPVDKVINVLEAPRLFSTTVNCDVEILQRLKDEIRNYATIFHVHTGARIILEA
jgi:hypothetical protein